MMLPRQRTLDAPPPPKPSVDRIVGQPKKLGPINDAHCFAVVSQEVSSAGVLLLIASLDPLAVIGGVWSVIVDSLNGVVGGRLFPHIGKKVLERQPPVTHTNTPASVATKPSAFGIAAASKHSTPGGVLGRSVADLSHSVRAIRLEEKFLPETSAAIGTSPSKAAGRNLFGCPAVALAQPITNPPGVLNVFQCDEPAKTLAGKVYEPWVLGRSIAFSHNFLLARNGGQRRRGVISASSPRFLRGTSIVAYRRMEAIYD